MSQAKIFGALRIAFGCVWVIDAWFKWQPTFQNDFVGQVSSALAGQPGWVAAWITLWLTIVAPHPHFFAVVVALGETAIAAGLIFGFCTRTALMGGILLSLIIWTVPEGFGGPYIAGSTDIGTGIIYVFVFLTLWGGECWRAYSLDSFISARSIPQGLRGRPS